MFARIISQVLGIMGSILLVLGIYIIIPALMSMMQDLATLYGLISLLGGLITHIISYLVWKATQKDSWKAGLILF